MENAIKYTRNRIKHEHNGMSSASRLSKLSNFKNKDLEGLKWALRDLYIKSRDK